MLMLDLFYTPFAEFEFMQRALVGVIAIALGGGPVGVFLMLRRMSLTGRCHGPRDPARRGRRLSRSPASRCRP